jgi:hypothetical protein
MMKYPGGNYAPAEKKSYTEKSTAGESSLGADHPGSPGFLQKPDRRLTLVTL